MNKKAYIRTLEAVIAIILVLVFIFMVTPKTQKISEEVPVDVREAQKFILQEVLNNETLRNCVISLEPPQNCKQDIFSCKNLDSFIKEHIPRNYDYNCEVCSTSASCINLNLPIDKSVYADDIFITNYPNKLRIVRLYLWRK